MLLADCKNVGKMKFDKTKWAVQEIGFTPPYRSQMLSDLVEHHKLSGMTYNDVINMLGQPNAADSASFSYDIVVDYGSDIDPVYVKYLEFVIAKDSVVTAIRIKEVRK